MATHRIFANTFYLLVADVANKLIALGFFVIAARHLGVENFGVLSFAVAYVTTFGVFADLGLALYVTREIARRPDEANVLVGNAIMARFILGIVVAALIALSAFIVGLPVAARGIVAIFSFLVVVNGLFLLVAGVFQGFECNIYTAIARTVQAVLLLLGAILLSRLAPRVDLFAWLLAGAATASAVAAYLLMTLRVVRPFWRLNLSAFARMLREALPMGISVVLVTAYYWNGSALLASLSSEREVGIFAAPHRLVLGLAVLGMAFSGAMYPHMARLYLQERERIIGVIGKALRFVSITAIPLAIFGAVFAAEAVGIIYGEAYADSATVLRVLAFWGCGTFYNSLLSNYYYSINRARYATSQAAISLLVNIAANLLLIPRFGALGAAMALLVAEFAGTVWLLSGVIRGWNRVDRRILVTGVGKCLAATLIAASFGKGASLFNEPVALGVAVMSYLLLLVALKCVSRADLNVLRVIVARWR